MIPVQTSQNYRVFIDSSVLIAAAISEKGAARDLLRQGFRGELDLYISSVVLEESERNLSLKAPEALSDFYVFRDLLAAQLIAPPESLILSTAEMVALKDAPIVAAGIRAEVTYLATYDRKHLLRQKKEIKVHFALTVATPDEILGVTVFDKVRAKNLDVSPQEAEADAAREIAAHRKSKDSEEQ